MDCSTSDTLISRKKLSCDTVIEIHKDNQRETVIVLDSESGEAEKNGYDDDDAVFMQLMISGGFDSFDQEGASVPEAEQKGCKTRSEEDVFNHIRKKAKTFPQIRTARTAEIEPVIPPRNLYQEDKSKSYHPVGRNSNISRDIVMISDLEPGGTEDHTYRSNTERNESHQILDRISTEKCSTPCLPTKVSSNQKEVKRPSPPLNIFCRKEEVPADHKERAVLPLQNSGRFSCKQKLDSKGSNMQLCSLDALGKNSPPSFLGFKSIFSFL